MTSLADDVVEEILNGFPERLVITCPVCKTNIDLASQVQKAISNLYKCAKCGFILPRQRKSK
ncbi:MAG: hypothetical protein NWE80_02100 [Candidatus Bathyarchaeota archaeon]|nr:hypothetical protein [Candidatus Bathyarchaeota archaeon]